MKIHVEGDSYVRHAIRRRLEVEGETVVDDARDAELIVASSSIHRSLGIPMVLESLSLPRLALDSMFHTSRESIDFVAIRWFDVDWCPWIAISIPLIGLMDEDLGPRVVTGHGSRFVPSPAILSMFETGGLMTFLHETHYTGFVSMSFHGPCVVDVSTGIPDHLGILEGLRCRLSEFLTNAVHNSLFESWTTSLLISRSPWPHSDISPRIHLDVSRDVERHLWLGDVSRGGKATWSDASLIGLATSWAPTLHESARRSLRTCRNLSIPLKQYRTDLAATLQCQWATLSSNGVLD